MITTLYKCDACNKMCKADDSVAIAEFPRRCRTYAEDKFRNKLVQFDDIRFVETHLCDACYLSLLKWTNIIEED